MKSDKISLFICWNGFQYNITGAVVEFFKINNYSVATLANPLFAQDLSQRLHIDDTGHVRTTRIRLLRPPFSYMLDPAYVLRGPKADVAISFSPHITWVLLVLRKFGRYKRVIQWNIDFSPRRFKNPILDYLYNKLDYIGFTRADVQIDLTEAASQARLQRHKNVGRSAHIVVPVGIEDDRINPIPLENFTFQNIFFLGNLSKYVGCKLLIETMPNVLKEFPNATLHIIGDGDIRGDLVRKVQELNLTSYVHWYGNQDREGIERLLSMATLGIAPYSNDPNSFSRYADPSKIKNYLQFALPIVTTNVTSISQKLFDAKVALECSDDKISLSKEICKLLGDESNWLEIRKNAEAFATNYKWSNILRNLECELHQRLNIKHSV